MKKLLFALTNVLLVNISVFSQEPVKSGQPGFDVKRANIAYGKIDTIVYASKTVDTLRRAFTYTPPGYDNRNKYPLIFFDREKF